MISQTLLVNAEIKQTPSPPRIIEPDATTSQTYVEKAALPPPPTTSSAPTKSAEQAICDVRVVVFGEELFPAWYPSFYPEDVVKQEYLKDGQLFVCRHCFKYTHDIVEVVAHEDQCELASGVPGTLVYASNPYSMYEVDGEEHKTFCQCLSLFAKLFLDNKSIYYDVEGFHFYLLCETVMPSDSAEREPTRIVGFFSKEKMSWDDYNLACILVFPPFQRRGLGRLLIAFSYELSKLNRKVGSPEKPLSDLGRLSYTSYWTITVARFVLEKRVKAISSVSEISKATCIHPEDVITALRAMDALKQKPENEKLVISKPRVKRWRRALRKGELEDPIDQKCIMYSRIHVTINAEEF